jgi:hypothetical protein
MSACVLQIDSTPGAFVTLIREDGSMQQCEAAAAASAAPFGYVHLPASDRVPPFFPQVAGRVEPGSPSATAQVYVGSSRFALFGGTPRLIYTGPDCSALVRVVASMPLQSGSFANALAIALNGDLNGLLLTDDLLFEMGAQFENDDRTGGVAAASIRVMTTERVLALTSGDSFGPVFGSEVVPAPGVAQSQGYTMFVQVLS